MVRVRVWVRDGVGIGLDKDVGKAVTDREGSAGNDHTGRGSLPHDWHFLHDCSYPCSRIPQCPLAVPWPGFAGPGQATSLPRAGWANIRGSANVVHKEFKNWHGDGDDPGDLLKIHIGQCGHWFSAVAIYGVGWRCTRTRHVTQLAQLLAP